MNAELLIEFLRIALNNVNSMYYGQLVREQMFEDYGIDQEHSKRKPLEKYLSRYGERVFCYELYHQIRKLMDNHEQDHPSQTPVYFQGELQKDQINGVIEYFDGVNGALQKEYIPDFLLHSVGDFSRQELIIEVKSDPKIPIKGITDDLLKIQEFITRYSYRRGIFLAINVPYEHLSKHLKTLVGQNWFENNLPNRGQILFIHKEQRGTPTREFNLDNLPLQAI